MAMKKKRAGSSKQRVSKPKGMEGRAKPRDIQAAFHRIGKSETTMADFEEFYSDQSNEPANQPRAAHQVIKDALDNWKTRQSLAPWWWLSFGYPSKGNEYAGTVIIRGWTFLDAVNKCNEMKLSPVMAQVVGEELSELWVPKPGEIERLLSQDEAKKVFTGVYEVTEASLYKPKQDEVKFTGFDGVPEFVDATTAIEKHRLNRLRKRNKG